MIQLFSKNVAYFPFFLIFVGDLQIPVGSSTFILPIAMIPIVFVLLNNFLSKREVIHRQSLFIFFTVLIGAVSLTVNPNASIPRGIVGMLPLFYIWVVIFCYSNVNLSMKKVFDYITAGAIFLSLQIFLDFINAHFLSGNYYEKKLLIETWLGRSNYLSAFLIIALGLSKRHYILNIIIFMGVCATMSRGGIAMVLLMYLISAFFYLKKEGGRSINYSLNLFVALLISALLIYILTFDFSKVDIVDLRSTFNRLELWGFSLNLYLDNFILGIGPNSFRTYVENTVGIEDVWGTHNSILQLLLNYGFFGCVLYIVYLAKIYVKISESFELDCTSFHLKSMLLIILIFSLFEPLVGSSSFEVFLILLFFTFNKKTKAY